MLPPLVCQAVCREPDQVIVSDKTRLCMIEKYFAEQYSSGVDLLSVQAHLRTDMPIAFAHWNARGLKSSLPGVKLMLHQHRPLALVVTETHLLMRESQAPWLERMDAATASFTLAYLTRCHGRKGQ